MILTENTTEAMMKDEWWDAKATDVQGFDLDIYYPQTVLLPIQLYA